MADKQQNEPGPSAGGDNTDSSDSDEVILLSQDEDDTADPGQSQSSTRDQQAEDSELEIMESDDEEIEEEMTIIELSDTEIKDEPEDDSDYDDIDIKEEPEDVEEGYIDLDPSQLGVVVTEAELPEDLLGEPVNGVYKCKFCPQKHENRSNLILHIDRHVRNGSIRKCRFCDFYTAVTHKLLEHERKHTKEKPFVCDICGHACRVKGDLSRHMHVHSSHRRYECNVCGHRSKTAGNMKHHKERHQPDLPRNFCCTLCGFAFKRQSALTAHLKRRHSATKPFFCPHCSFCSKTMYELKSHKAKHFDDHPFECTWRDCGKAFKTKSDCTKHMKRHSGTRNYMCSICGKAFFCSTMLKRHAAAHSDVRNFECGECLKKFKTRKALETHIHTHQDIKPYQCDVCYKTFNSQSNMNTHMRVHGAGRPYQCPICMHGSREMDHLMTHIGQKHLHNFTYICGLCRKPFGKSMHLQFHIQRCHKKEMDGRQEVMAFDPEYLGLDLEPEPSGAFDPATYAKYLAAETTATFGGKTFIAKSSPVKKEPRLSGASEDSGISSGSTNSRETGSRSPESLSLPPVVQVARFGGVPVCLARKNAGVQMNCQKRGKKPKYWFMDASLMTEEDREKHFEYLRKKEGGLLPQSRRRKKYKKKAVSWQPRPSTSGSSQVKGKGKGKRKRRRVVLDTEEEEEEEEEAYRLAQEVMMEVDRPNTSSTEFPGRVSSRKRTVMIKNVPHEVFDQPPKKNLAFTSTNLHDARNKAANRSQNKKIVKKKLHQKSTKSKAKSPKTALCDLQKLPCKKRSVSSYMEKDQAELGISWDLTSASWSSVSKYSAKMAAANSKCWADAVSLAATTGCYRPDKHTDASASSIPKEKCTDDMREEFSGQCPQDQTQSDMNGHGSLCSDPSGDVAKEILLSGDDLAKQTCLGVENTHEESGVSMENDVRLQSVTDGPDDASIQRDSTECLEVILNAVSAGCIHGEVLLPLAADISDACIWQETSECLSALVDTVSGEASPSKNTIEETSECLSALVDTVSGEASPSKNTIEETSECLSALVDTVSGEASPSKNTIEETSECLSALVDTVSGEASPSKNTIEETSECLSALVDTVSGEASPSKNTIEETSECLSALVDTVSGEASPSKNTIEETSECLSALVDTVSGEASPSKNTIEETSECLSALVDTVSGEASPSKNTIEETSECLSALVDTVSGEASPSKNTTEETSECLSALVDTVSGEASPSKNTTEETSECLSALVDTVSGEASPSKNTIEEVKGPNELSVQDCAESQQIGRPQVNQFLSALSQSNIDETIAASLPSQQSFGADTIRTVAAEMLLSSEKDDHLELLPAERDNRKRIEDSNKCLHVLVSDVCINHHALDNLDIFGVNRVSLDVSSASPQHNSQQKQKVIKSRQLTANKIKPAQSPMKAAGRTKASPQKISKRKELAQKTDTESSSPAVVKKLISSSTAAAENAEAPGIGGLLLATAAVSKATKSPEKNCTRVGRLPGRRVGRPPGKKVGKLPGKRVQRPPGEPPGERVGRPPGRPPGKKVGRPPGKAAALGSKEPNNITSPKKTRMLEQSENRTVGDPELVKENHEAGDSQDSPSFTIKMEFDEPESVDSFCVVGTVEHEHTEHEGDDSVKSDNENAMSPHNVAVGNSEAFSKAAALQSTTENSYTSEQPKPKTDVEQTKISAESGRKIESSQSAKLSDDTNEIIQRDIDSQGVASKDDLTENQNVTQKCLQSNDESTADPCIAQNSPEDTSSPDASSSPAPSPTTSPRKSERARKATPPVTHPHSKKVVENLRKLLNKIPYARLPAGVKKLGIFPSHQQNAASKQIDQLGATKKLSFDNEAVIATAKLSGDLEETERTVCKVKAPNSSAEFSGDFEKVYKESTEIPVHTDDNLEREEAARVMVVAEPSSVNNEAELPFSLKELDMQNNPLHIQEKAPEPLSTAECDDERQQDPSKDRAIKTFSLETSNTIKQVDAASSFSADRDAESCAQKNSSASKTDQGFDTDIQKKVSSDESGSKKCAANIEHSYRSLDKDTERCMHRNRSPEKVSQSLVNVAYGKNASEETEAEAGETNDEMSTTVSDNNFLADIDEAKIMQRDPSLEILDENPPKDGQTVTTFSQSTTSSEDFQSITSTESNNVNSANMDEGKCLQCIPDNLTVQESAISEESSGPQGKPKRKVGRPRKSPIPSLNASEVVSNKSTVQETMYSSELPSDTKVKMKRKAGRPRKTSVPASESGGLISNSGIVTERLESHVHSGTKVNLKRRVGRPKKTPVLGLKAGDVVSNNNALQDKAADIVPSGAAGKISTNAEGPQEQSVHECSAHELKLDEGMGQESTHSEMSTGFKHPTQPKKAGRPPKQSVHEQGACQQVSDNHSIQEMVVSDAPSSTEMKRKVGRPQKKPVHEQDTSDVVSNTSTVQEEVVSMMSLDTGPKLKRKPGRPRKSLLQGSGISDENRRTVQGAVSSVSSIMQGNHPKKGGRPRKHPVEQSSDSRTVQAADVPYGTEVKQPRKVGRPCKNFVDRSVTGSRLAQGTGVCDVPSCAGVKHPRKVGRPKKQSLPDSGQEQRPRKVGRPRKHSLPGSCQEQQNRADGARRKPHTGSRVMGKEHLKLWAKIKQAQASSTKPSAKSVRMQTAFLTAASAAAKTIVKRSRNSAFKILKPNSSPLLKRAGKEMTKKRKRFMYVETDMGTSPDPPPKKRGRKPGPKIVLDRSQTNLCFEPQQLMMSADQVGDNLGNNSSFCMNVSSLGFDAIAGEETPSLLVLQSGLLGSSLTQGSQLQIPVEAESQLISAVLPTQIVVSAPASLLSGCAEASLLQKNILSINSDIREVPDIKPDIAQLNEAVPEDSACLLPDVKPLIDELRYLNQAGMGQIDEPAASQLSTVEEPTNMNSVAGDKILSQPEETPQSHIGSDETSEPVPEVSSSTLLQSCTPSQGEATQLCTVFTCQPSLSSVSSQNAKRRPVGKPPGKPVRKKAKDPIFIPHVKDTFHPRFVHDTERRRSYRPKKQRLTDEQIRRAQCQDSVDSDLDDVEDDGSDIEFVTADYTKVDPAAKKQFLENLRLDIFPFGQEGEQEESADTNQAKINNAEQNEDNAATETVTAMRTDEMEASNNPINERDNDDDEEVWGEVSADLMTDADVVQDNTVNCPSDAEPVGSVDGLKTDMQATRGITEDPSTDAETVRVMTGDCDTDVEAIRGITGDLIKDAETKMGVTRSLFTDVEDHRGITDIPTDTEAMRSISVKLSTEAEAVRSICSHSEEVPAATECKIEDGCCNCQDVKPNIDSKDNIITNLPVGVKDEVPDNKTENIKNSLSFSAEECFLSAAPGLDADVFVDNFPTLAGPAVSLAEHADVGVTQDQRLASLGGVQQLPQTPPAHRVQVPITPGGDQASPSLTIFVKTSDGQRVWLEDGPQSFVKDEFTQ